MDRSERATRVPTRYEDSEYDSIKATIRKDDKKAKKAGESALDPRGGDHEDLPLLAGHSVPSHPGHYEGPYCLETGQVKRIIKPDKQGLTIGNRWYPWSEWNVLRPGATLAFLRCLAKHFSLLKTIQLLALTPEENDAVGDLLHDHTTTMYDIHADELVYTERILLTHCNASAFTNDIMRCLNEYSEITTSWEEITAGHFDLGVDWRVCDCNGDELRAHNGLTGFAAWMEELETESVAREATVGVLSGIALGVLVGEFGYLPH